MNKKVSVIIGTFNREKLFLKAVNSALEQTYKNLEVILVDDASTDDTKIIATSINDNRFKYIQNDLNQKIAKVSNIGFESSDGDYIALLGDDDEWFDKDKIAKQLKIFEQDKNLGIVGTWWQEDNEKKIFYKKPKEPTNWEERVLMGGGVVCGSTVLIKREAWKKTNGFDESQTRGTDSDLFRRIVLSGYKAKILYENTTSVNISPNRKRMTQQNSLESLDHHIKNHEYNLKKLKEYYDMYPKAKAKYYEKIGGLYRRRFLITKKNLDYEKAIDMWRLSLKSNRLNAAVYAKMFITFFNQKMKNE